MNFLLNYIPDIVVILLVIGVAIVKVDKTK